MFLDNLIKSLHKSIYRYPEVLEYLASRLVTKDEIEKYQLGYSKIIGVPDDPDDYDLKSFKDDCNNGRKIENKLVFPFKNAIGNVVGLVGRSVTSKEFKVFVGDQAKFEGFFFGLYEALPHIYRENKVYIVEGPFDHLAFSKVMPNTVAALTAKMSDAQYDYLMLFCDRVITVFDSDKAGDLGREKASYKYTFINDLKMKNVQSLNLGFKDPAKLLEEYKFDKFKDYILKKVNSII